MSSVIELPRGIGEKVDPNDIANMLQFFQPYSRGGSPRAGCVVRHATGHRHARVLAVSRIGHVMTICEDCGSPRLAWREEVVLERFRERQSAAEVFKGLVQTTRDFPTCPYPYWAIAGFFNGNLGPRFRNPVSLAWAAIASLQLHPRGQPSTQRWAQQLCAEIGDGDNAPALLRTLAEQEPGTPWPATEVDAATAIQRALEAGIEQLGLLTQYQQPEETPAEQLARGTLCLDMLGGGEVAIIGPSLQERDPGWYDVVEMEFHEVLAAHVDDLAVVEEAVDEAEVAALLVRACRKAEPIAMQWLLSDASPAPQTDPALRTLLAGAMFRAAAPNSPAARVGYRLLFASYKEVAKDDRKRLGALLPELVNTKAKAAHAVMGTADRVLIEWGARQAALSPPASAPAARAEESSAPLPEPAPAAVLAAPVSVEPPIHVAPPVAADIPELDAPPPETEPPPQRAVLHLRTEPSRAAVEPAQELERALLNLRIRPKPATSKPAGPRSLRFKITDHALLAQEWPLQPVASAYAEAVATTLSWLSQRIGITLPAHWKTGGHEIEQGGISLQVEAAAPVFAFRLEHPDTQNPTRTWRVEGTILLGANGVGGMVGLRLSAADRTELPKPFPSVPQLVREWLQSPGLLVADQPAGERQSIDDEVSFAAFRSTVESPGRDGPVVVVEANMVPALPTPLAGLALVYLLHACKQSTYAAAFRRLEPARVHLFTPGHAIPVAFPTTSAGLQQMLESAMDCRQRPQTPTFREIRDEVRDAAQRLYARALETTRAPAPAVAAPSADAPSAPVDAQAPSVAASAVEPAQAVELPAPVSLEPARSAYSELQELFDMALEEKEEQEHELEATREEVRTLKAKVHALTAALGNKTGNDSAPILVLPDTLEDLPDWCANLAPRIVIADKALRFAARTDHREVGRIYATLIAMRDLYWSMRWGSDETARSRWLEFLTLNRMTCGPTGRAVDDARYADAYSAVFGKRTVAMSMHIQGSSSRDPLRCIRIYFEPDDANQVILIGHLPTHLTSSLS